MSWFDGYKAKLTSPEKAVQAVKSGHRVYYSGNAATPFPLIQALTSRRDELTDVQMLSLIHI
ncbi:MAG: hypothetical protein QUU85_10085 [Candidatus Eisenbacteria bacterium]|nr:hypothetical protein [Candidatus Eisenbacteria bacterium]